VGVDSFDELLGVDDPRGLILKFVEGMDLAPGTTNVYGSQIKSFYRYMGVEVGRIPQVRNHVVYPHKILTREEVRTFIEFGDIRDKALIWFLYSSGSRISAALGLNVGRLDFYKDPPVPVKFRASETKYNVRYTTFLCVDAVNALKNYLRWRRKQGEQISPDSPLFATKYKTKLSYAGSTHIIKRLIGKAGIKIEEDERLNHHSFRAAFQHTLQVAGVNQYIIEKLMGHSVEHTVAGRYSIGLTDFEIREAYALADWTLEVNEAKVRDLEEKIDETQRVLGAQSVENRMLKESRDVEMRSLRETVDELTQRMIKSEEDKIELMRLFTQFQEPQ